MKLIELEPRWYMDANGNMGISFLCPHCRDIRLAVLVDRIAPYLVNVPFPDASAINIKQRMVWQISGEAPVFDGIKPGGFENVSLMPSIDVSSFGHWHGFITDGEIR